MLRNSLRYLFNLFLLLTLIVRMGFAQCEEVPMSILDGTNGFVTEGKAENDDLGYDVKGAGDVNGDGIDDIIIGAPRVDVGGVENAGEAYIIFGGSGVAASPFDIASLDGSNGFVVQGSEDNERLGTSVSIAGDINNDGLDDILIGSPDERGLGSVMVIFGKASGFDAVYTRTDIDGANGIIIESETNNISFGNSLSYAGDINDDGIDDIIIVAPSGIVEGFFRAGLAYVIFGAPTIAGMNVSSLNGTNGFKIEGFPQTGAAEFSKVSSAGDINNDGVDDIILGFPRFDEGGVEAAGRACIVFGRSSGFPAVFSLENLNGSNGFSVLGTSEYAGVGVSVASAKDFNNDGIEDIIIGASGYGGSITDTGKAYVIYGKNTAFSGTFDVASLDGSNGLTISGDIAYERLGTAVDGLADVNGDGISDIIISALGGGVGEQGAVYIVFGGNTHPAHIQAIDIWNTVGYQVYDDTNRGFSRQNFGYAISGVGDFNDDGVNDFAIGAIGRSDSYREHGRAYIFYGNTFTIGDTEVPTITCPASVPELHANSTLPNYSFLLADVEDNCTEHWDLTFSQVPVQGTLFTDDVEVEVTVYDRSGNSNSCTFWVRRKVEKIDISCSLDPFSVGDIDETDGTVIYGEKAMGGAGYDVDHAGDVNGDGIDDFIVGAKGENHFATGPFSLWIHTEGAAYVVFGRSTGFPPNLDLALLDGTDGFIIRNDTYFRQAQEMGYAISSAGDINGDGIDDIMLSDPGRINEHGSWMGEVFVIFGKSSGYPSVFKISDLDGTNGFTIRGIDGSGFLGRGIDNIGDVNNDGRDDIAFITGGHGAGSGKCHIIYGTNAGFPALITTDQLNGSNGMTIQGGDTEELNYISQSVAGLGDINGDGIDDIAISGRRTGGDKFVVYGSPGLPAHLTVTDLDGTNGFSINHSEDDTWLKIGRAGDVNNDGFNDVLIGINYVLFGGSSLPAEVDLANLNGANGFALVANKPNENPAYINYGGDFNNDGTDDLIFITEGRFSRDHIAYVLYGKSTWEDSVFTASLTFQDALPVAFNSFGLTYPDVSGSYAGDVNNDGIDDVIIGLAPSVIRYDISSHPGYAYVIYGREITDTEVPDIACPDGQILDVGDVLPDYTDLATASDECTRAEDIVVTQSPSAGSAFTPGMTITLTATDISGNSATCTFRVRSDADTEAPSITCPGDQELACDATVPDYTSLATATDNEDPSPTVTQSPAPGSAFTPGMTITLIVEDASGNENTCTFTVNEAADTEDPSITCPGDQELASGATLPDYTSLASASDNCDSDPVISQSPAVGSAFTDGMTVTLTATDVSGNENTCTFTVNQSDDTEAPSITCPDDQELACDATVPDYTSLATATDNEDPSPTVTQSPAPGSAFTRGMTITLTAEDASGNENTCTFTVNEAADTEDPSITCPGDQELAFGATLPDYTGLATASDNCDSDPEITQNPVAGSGFTDGMTVTLTTTDANGNENTCTFTINQAPDTEAPSITCPGDQELACSTVLPDYTSLVTVSDNQDTSPNIAQSPAPGSVFTHGMMVTFTATDASGNENTCTFTVSEVEDQTPPVLTCPEETVIACGSALPDFTSQTAVSDNCDEAPVLSQSPVTGTVIMEETVVTITATDHFGNQSSCTFTVKPEPGFTVDAGADQQIVSGEILILEAFSVETGDYFWSPEESIDSEPVGKSITVAPEQSTTYTVKLTREDGCSASDELTVEVIPREGFKDRYGFSPDGDGINETWEISGIQDYPENNVSVFNKWGQLVYKTKNYHNTLNSFDGTANQLTEWGAGELPEGTYYFVIQFPDGSRASVNGFIVIKR